MTPSTPLPDWSDHGFTAKELLGANVEGGRQTWLACSVRDPNYHVVIKQFSFAQASASWEGFKAHEREISILERLDHPRIPKVLTHFETSQGFCLVQQYCPAPTLAARKQRWQPAEVEAIALQVLDILAYLQDYKPTVLHRDIKPQNLLQDAHGRVVLIDFGLGKAAGAQESSSSVAVGTPGFMAPEQMLGRELDERADLYGLGMTCVALLSGLGEGGVNRLVDDRLNVDLTALGHTVPPYFTQWLREMSSPARGDRPVNARAARARLEALKEKAKRLPSRQAPARQAPPSLRQDSAHQSEALTQKATYLWPKFLGYLWVIPVVVLPLVLFMALETGESDPSPSLPPHSTSSGGEPPMEQHPWYEGDACPYVKTEYAKGVRLFQSLTIPKTCHLILEGVTVGKITVEPGGTLELRQSTVTAMLRVSQRRTKEPQETRLRLDHVVLGSASDSSGAYYILSATADIQRIRVYGKLHLDHSKTTWSQSEATDEVWMEGGSLEAEGGRIKEFSAQRGAQVDLNNLELDVVKALYRYKDPVTLSAQNVTVNQGAELEEKTQASFTSSAINGYLRIRQGATAHLVDSTLKGPMSTHSPADPLPKVILERTAFPHEVDPTKIDVIRK